ncbi:ribosomal RNA small subunit methyltransferase E [Bacteroidia bacterium]|nr:ribosomal RNA small subunit methyltransferase E [Bacteroidia bacterium]
MFYAPDIATLLVLPDTEAQHCVRVLRKQVGDVIDITDGKGFFYKALIVEAHPNHCEVQLLETQIQPLSWSNRIEIAVAPTKNLERIEWFVEKATEIGVNKITLLHTQHSERKDVKTERIQKIVVSAMKQSLKATLPEIQGMTAFKRFVRRPFEGLKCIAHCNQGEKQLLSTLLAGRSGDATPNTSTLLAGRSGDATPNTSTLFAERSGDAMPDAMPDATPDATSDTGENVMPDVLILIGPEGDFSESEVEEALAYGFLPISLGESRLRTETAALYALHAVHVLMSLRKGGITP